MIKKLPGSRARQLLGGFALCAFAVAAQADPFSLQGVCRLTSAIAGAGQCQLEFVLSDAFTASTNIKSSVIRVDGIIVSRYWNDRLNPVPSSVPYVSGSTAVACGVSHVVTAVITRVGVGTPAEGVGALPAVVCPTVP
jgi:hypothetical protein